jgi:hypothetical protein
MGFSQQHALTAIALVTRTTLHSIKLIHLM